MEAKENIHFLDKVASALRKAATELEEFQVQANLGKDAAIEKFEEIKLKMTDFATEAKKKAEAAKDKVEDLVPLFEQLQVQLALGKAETKEKFEEQKKKILALIKEIEDRIKKSPFLNDAYAFAVVELEKYKAQLDWIENQYNEGKETVKDKFEQGKAELERVAEKIKNKIAEKDDGRWDHFQGEISEAFGHIRNAFSKPE